MQRLNLEQEYRAAIYLRLSKDDGDFSVTGQKLESDSISNQRLLIKSFLKKHPEIVSAKEFCDDGYTGTNFERPDFQKMMSASILAGRSNKVYKREAYLRKLFSQENA